MASTGTTISPFVTGDYLSPPGARLAGRRVVAVAYLIHHPEATLLFDTGFPLEEPYTVQEGGDPVPTYPRSLADELARLGTSMRELHLVANCHLHVDHADPRALRARPGPLAASCLKANGMALLGRLRTGPYRGVASPTWRRHETHTGSCSSTLPRCRS